MFDWNLRTQDSECSLDNEDSTGPSYLLYTAERQRQTAHYQLVGVGKACRRKVPARQIGWGKSVFILWLTVTDLFEL
jgi:hypothetical protein